MALQIRRGLESQRAAVTPAAGELLYTTDNKLVYVGDGTLAGGKQLLSNLVEDTSPQLGGNLDATNRTIFTLNNGDIDISPDGTGTINFNSTVRLARLENTGNIVLAPTGTVNVNVDLNVGRISNTGDLNIAPTGILKIGSSSLGRNGNVYITRNNYSPNLLEGFTFAQHHSVDPRVADLTLYRTRGTETSPLAVENNDFLGAFSFSGYNGTDSSTSAGIFGIVEGTITNGRIPTKISFGTENGTNQLVRAELSSAGVWKVNQISALTGTSLTINSTITSTTTPGGTYWNYDASGNKVLSMTIGQTVNFSNFSGSILVDCYNSGTVTQYLCGGGGGGATAIGSSKSGAPTGTMADNSGINGYTFTATETGDHSFYVIRTRAGA